MATALVYLKSTVVGALVAIAAVVFWLGACVGMALLGLPLMARTGSGGLGAVSMGFSEASLIMMVVGFVAGFRWEFRRASRANPWTSK